MDLKIFDFGTLNEKDRPFLLEDNELSVAENVMRDNAGNLVTRSGFLEKVTLPSDVVEVAYYRSKNEYIVFSNPSSNHLRIDIYNADTYALKRKYVHTGETGQRLITQFGSVGQITEINYTEYQNNIYFIYIANGNPAPILKYDGCVIRQSGLPEPEGIITSGSGYFYRTAYKTYDYNGNITYGPYRLSSNVSFITSYRTLKSVIGYQNYAIFTNTPSSGIEGPVLTATQNTLDNLNHNYKENDFLMIFNKTMYTRSALTSLAIESPANREFVVLEIQSVTSSSITFKPSSLVGISINTQFVIPGTFLDTQTRLINFGSVDNGSYSLIPFEWFDDPAFGEKGYIDSAFISNQNDTFSSSANYSIMSTLLWEKINAETIYDSTTMKFRPPLCKYVEAYGNQLVFGNIYGIWAERNTFIPYNNNDLIMYSDISDGDSGENISRINRQLIGESFDGQVTGLCRVRDSLIAAKDNAIFSIDGELYSGGYSLRKIETNNIGCKSTKSFLQVEGGVTFHGNDGIYFMNSYNAKKITEKMDPFFGSDIDITKTRSVVRFANDQHLYYIKKTDGHYFVVFDFNYKRWFKWKALNASCGIFSKPDGEVLFSDGLKIYDLGGSQTDNGTPIVSKFKTKYFDLGAQSLIKKFIKCRVLDMIGGGSLSVSVYRDWSNTPIVAESPLVVDLKTKHKYIPLTNGVSCAIEFTNSTSDMIISGLIIEFEPWQVNDRNN